VIDPRGKSGGGVSNTSETTKLSLNFNSPTTSMHGKSRTIEELKYSVYRWR
jgi:hypothetical protein